MLQVLEITDRVVVAVNLMDEARRKGIDVDVRSLSRDLGVPAVPVVARTGEGMHALLDDGRRRVSRRAGDASRCASQGTPEFNAAIAELVPLIEAAAPGVPNARWIAIRLLDGDAQVEAGAARGRAGNARRASAAPDDRFSQKIALQGAQ